LFSPIVLLTGGVDSASPEASPPVVAVVFSAAVILTSLSFSPDVVVKYPRISSHFD
jgi:hypothetical protein